jgi:hypothetical protein
MPPASSRAGTDDAAGPSGLAGHARGQVHTLEAVVAAMLLLTSVIFALQMTSVTPLSASTSSQHVENQQQAAAEGVLAGAADSGALERAVLFWNETGERFHNATEGRYYTRGPPDNDFGDALDRVFGTRGIAYNVYVTYQAGDGSATRRQRMVYVGEPSDNAVRASRTVVVSNEAVLRDSDGNRTGTRVAETSDFYAPDVASGSVYNSLRVEVVAWRI